MSSVRISTLGLKVGGSLQRNRLLVVSSSLRIFEERRRKIGLGFCEFQLIDWWFVSYWWLISGEIWLNKVIQYNSLFDFISFQLKRLSSSSSLPPCPPCWLFPPWFPPCPWLLPPPPCWGTYMSISPLASLSNRRLAANYSFLSQAMYAWAASSLLNPKAANLWMACCYYWVTMIEPGGGCWCCWAMLGRSP